MKRYRNDLENRNTPYWRKRKAQTAILRILRSRRKSMSHSDRLTIAERWMRIFYKQEV